ncbi:hypothetical protein [Streptomyces sp. NPDC002088]|uniref:hypothetical protein n=1 Tax=Streptomyces sp. NPDC002088 TaxID=3154665 RepID=UPI003329E6D0
MDLKSAAQGIRTYAKSAATAFDGQAQKLADAARERPNTIDVTQDFEAFMTARAMWLIYSEAINVSIDGNSPLDDAKLVDRIQDKRRSLDGWLRQAKTMQSGLYAVHQHLTTEAVKRFLSDTYFVDDLDEEQK